MKEQYTHEGITYVVSQANLAKFLEDKPGAVKVGKTNGSAGANQTGESFDMGSVFGGGSSVLQKETRNKISASLKKHKGSFFAEENVADDLRLALDGTDWDVTESNVMGRGGINAISLKSEGGVSKTFNIGSGEDVSQEMISFINNNPTRSPEYIADKEDFMSSMDSYYTKDKIKDLTSKEFLADLEDEEEFKEAIKKDLGYGGIFTADNRTKYPSLKDEDIDHLIKTRFNKALNVEEVKVREDMDADFIERLNSGEYIDQVTGNKLETEQQFFDQYTENSINSIENLNERDLASINMKLLKKGLSVDDKKKLLIQRDEAVATLKSEGEFEIGFDSKTGMLVKKPKTRDNVYKDFESAEASVKKVKSDIESSFSSLPKDSHMGIAQNRYYRNAKQITELNALMREEVDYSVENVTAAARGIKQRDVEKSSLKNMLKRTEAEDGYGVRSLVTKGLQMLIGAPSPDAVPIPLDKNGQPTMSEEQFADKRKRVRSQLRKLQIEQEALKRIYLLNESGTSIEKKTPAVGDFKFGLFGQQSGKLALNAVVNNGWEQLTGNKATETEIIDEYTNIFNDAGIPVSAELQNYSERSFGQQVTEGVSGSTGILLEFAVANKATAALRAAKMFKGGKTFNDLINGAKATRYQNSAGRIMTEAQILAKANKAKKYTTVSSWASKYMGPSTVKIGPNKVKWLGAALTEGLIEGAKFGVLPSSSGNRANSFATGFGFGLAGQFLTPILGTIKAPKLDKAMYAEGAAKSSKVKNWVIDQAPRLDKAYNLAFKAPLSFAVGSELGEVSLAMAKDAMGLDEVSTFLKEHYDEYSDPAQRFLVNMAVGSTFGLTHKATYTNWKSLEGLRSAKAEAESKMYETSTTYRVKKKGVKRGQGVELTPEQWLKKDSNAFDIIHKPGDLRIKQSIIELPAAQRVEVFNKHKDVADAMEHQIRKSEDALDLYDPVLAPFRLEKMYRDQNQHYIEKGATIEVVRADNNSSYFKEYPTAKAKTEYIDGKGNVHADFKQGLTKKVRQTFNVDKIEPGIAPHELGHSGMSILFGTNARLKADFLTKMMNIAAEVPMEYGAEGAKRTLKDALVEQNGKWDTNRNSYENARINEWEVFSHLAEQLAKPENLRALQSSKAFEKFDNLIEKNVGEKLNQKYDFKTHKDVVRFFADYIKTINKGSNSLGALKHLDGVIYKGKEGEAEGIKSSLKKEGMNFDGELQSRDLSLEKSKLFNRNIELGKTQPKGFRVEMDDNVKKIKELNKNIKASELNAEQIAKYKEAVSEEAKMKEKPEGFINPKREMAFKSLRENNAGILNDFVNKNYKEVPGSNLTKAELKNYVENNEFLKILNSYNVKSNVPFGAYLKQNLRPRMGNILKALGVDLGSKMKTVSLDSPEAMQVESEAAGSFSKEVAGANKGIELVYDLPVKQETINSITSKVSSLDVTNIDYKTLKDLMPSATKEMFGKTNLEKAKFIADNWKTIYELLPQNTSEVSGKATGIENSILKDFYVKKDRVKMSKTGDAAGNAIQEKIKMSKPEFLEKLGITQKLDGIVDISGMNRNIKTSTIPSIINQTGKAITNQLVGKEVLQSGRENAATIFNQITSGKSKALQSKKLEIQGFKDQVNLLYEVQNKEFAKMLKGNLNIYREDASKAVSKTLVDYFSDFKARGNEFGISNKDLRTIGKELHAEFQFTGITPIKIASKAAKAIVLPNSLRGIDAKAGLEHKPFRLDDVSEVIEARAATRVVVKSLVEKYGDGVYENLLLLGESGGTGVGSYMNFGEMVAGANRKTNRFSLHESSQQALEYMSDIKNSKGKKYKGLGRNILSAQGDKAGQMKRLIDSKTGDWSTKNLKEAFEAGEFNKTVLKDAVEALRKAYDKGEITHTQANQWVSIHGGPMTGLIKLAGSFAVTPNMTAKQMFKLFPERVKNKDGVVESNYVLEHTTPAQYVKSRIYDYIINGGSTKKSAMDLTLRDYHTTLIPKQFDTMVNKTLQTELPSWHLPGMDPVASRYYEVNHPSNFGFGLKAFAGNNKGRVYDHNPNMNVAQKIKAGKQLREINKNLFPKGLRKAVGKELNSKQLEIAKNIDKALTNGRKKNKKSRGMSTFDFDETAGISDNFVIATKGKQTKRIASSEWPVVGESMVKEGWKMDFSDFNKVTNGRPGPLMQKLKNQIRKYGNENVFILTARAKESQGAIHEYLKSEGVELPLKNITGLGNSTGEAKALWMLEKFAEGYNDMYFVDDAISNVKAVKDVLNQLDIKSSVQQALQTKNLNVDINNIMEHSLNIKSKKVFSNSEGKVRGRDKKRRKFFMTDSASDMELLMEPLYGKGKKGMENKKWFEDNLYKPWERGINDLNTARQTILNDYMSLRKNNKDIVKSLDKAVDGTNFTVDQAARVYIWNKAGFEIPGLTKTSKAKLLEHVTKNPKLQAYAESVAVLTKIETGLKQPKETWYAETIATEVQETGTTVGREKYIGEWIQKKNEVFTKENMAKMESELGPKWRESIENMFSRMETGRTRKRDLGRIGNEVMNYLNGSVGAIMNFNTRSATLQLMSSVNFINHAENNVLRAGKAFANQPQYWKDFMTIMNSDMLKQRRDGLKINVTEAELAAAVHGPGNKAKKALAWILKQGYIPTKMADSFAISSGGATYYRNRAIMYQKQGLSLKKAEAKAFIDFAAIAEKTQQSSRADLLSQQQTSFEGRLLLPFANTPMQMNRIMIKEALDIGKGRYKGSFGENSLTNKMSKIAYYGFVQSAIFAGLQSGLFALMANGGDEEKIAKGKVSAYNTMADSFLRGMGIPGVVASGIKNAGLSFLRENSKDYNADYSEVAEALLNMSPTIGSKFSKLDQAGNTYKYNKKDILEKGFSLDNQHGIEAAAKVIEATTNVPISRALRKTENIKGALDERNENWQRGMMLLGWGGWGLGVEEKDDARVPYKRQDFRSK